MAKVDILLPYWGDLELLKQTVNSVLAQTEQDWKLQVFDDCYPSDEPKAYFKSLKDPRISYYRHKENIGITANFNHALNSATANYCVIPGCDDVFLPNYLEEALANVGEADFYQPGVEVIDDNGTIYLPIVDRVKRLLQPKTSGYYGGENLATSLCHGNWLYFPSILWKTDTIKKYGFEPKYKIVEDLVLELTIISNDGELYFDKTPSFQYRRSAKSLSSVEKNGVRFNEEDAAYTAFVTIFTNKGWRKAARAARMRITSRVHRALS